MQFGRIHVIAIGVISKKYHEKLANAWKGMCCETDHFEKMPTLKLVPGKEITSRRNAF